MASDTFVIPDQYENKTPASDLDRKTLHKMVWRSIFLQASFNYERMQACGWLYSMLPGLKKIHGENKNDLAASMSHNLEFFNTHPFLVTLVMGIVLSMEQHKADIPMIRAVRVSAMGPLGGIGDALFWLTLVPITAGITSNMAIAGNIAAPFIFLAVFNIFQFVLRFFLMSWSYKVGMRAIEALTVHAKEFTRAASILGVFVVGCLTVCYGATKLGLIIPNGTTHTPMAETALVSTHDLESGTYDEFLFENDKQHGQGTYKQYQADPSSIVLRKGVDANKKPVTASIVKLNQKSNKITYIHEVASPVTIDIQAILDGMCPKLIPLAITLLLYFLLSKRNWTPLKCIFLVLVIGLIGSGFGLFPCIWPAS